MARCASRATALLRDDAYSPLRGSTQAAATRRSEGTPDIKKKQTWPRVHTLKIRVTTQERAEIERLAKATGLPVAVYLRTLGMAYQPRSILDAQRVRELLKACGDLGRLGGLLKLWLTERPGSGAPETDVRALLQSIQELRERIVDKVAAV